MMIEIQTHYQELDLVMKQGCTSIDCLWSHLQENLLQKGYQKQAYYMNQNPFKYCPQSKRILGNTNVDGLDDDERQSIRGFVGKDGDETWYDGRVF